MKSISIILNSAIALLLVTFIAACDHSHEHEGHEHDESLQLTAYNHQFEVYAEVTPLTVGQPSDVVAHFTWLSNFKPLEKGRITVINRGHHNPYSETIV